MQMGQIIGLTIAIVVLAAVGWWIYQQSRSRHLQSRFGPEYDRRVTEHGRRQAEAALAESEIRTAKVKTQPLSASDRARFTEEWRLCQARFVDDPPGAVDDADHILTNVMRTRGYAVDDPNDRVTDVVSAYPERADDYRRANEIIIRRHRGEASTEELRKAFMHFRSLFDEILGDYDEHKRAA